MRTDERTPAGGMTAAEIRKASIAAGEEIRGYTDELPDSPSKTEFLRIQGQLGDFWRDTASDEFCHQWMLVALAMQS